MLEDVINAELKDQLETSSPTHPKDEVMGRYKRPDIKFSSDGPTFLKVLRGTLRGCTSPPTDGGGSPTNHSWTAGDTVEVIGVKHSAAWSSALIVGAGGWVSFWTIYDEFLGKG